MVTPDFINGKWILQVNSKTKFSVKIISKDDFIPILKLRKKHQKLETDGLVSSLDETQITQIEKEWFETVLLTGLEGFLPKMMTEFDDDALSELSAYTFAILSKEFPSMK